jgi:hypothetical protein
MLKDFQLAALVKTSEQWRLLRIPLHQHLQNSLAASWQQQYEAFTADMEEIAFDPGYTLEEHERFRVKGYVLPEGLQAGAGGQARNLESINNHENLIGSIKAIIAFARNVHGDELMLAQSFTRSHVIQPGHFLFLQNDTYESPKRTGLSLGSRLAALYNVNSEQLLFENFRNTNAFLPLTDFIAEASDHDIREVLSHHLLKPQDIEATTAAANQWTRKRFAMLKASKILDQYTATQLVKRSKGYEVEVKVEKGRIVFPADKHVAKRLLQFLNEEIFRGPITEKLYETNSKREADA